MAPSNKTKRLLLALAAPLAAVAAQLRDEGLLAAHADEVDRILDAMTDVQPWYVGTMIGFGAWLASLLLIGFVAGIGINFDGGVAIIGLFFVALGVYLRRTSAGDFAVQGFDRLLDLDG